MAIRLTCFGALAEGIIAKCLKLAFLLLDICREGRCYLHRNGCFMFTWSYQCERLLRFEGLSVGGNSLTGRVMQGRSSSGENEYGRYKVAAGV